MKESSLPGTKRSYMYRRYVTQQVALYSVFFKFSNFVAKLQLELQTKFLFCTEVPTMAPILFACLHIYSFFTVPL
jgi:hypothetical protein